MGFVRCVMSEKLYLFLVVQPRPVSYLIIRTYAHRSPHLSFSSLSSFSFLEFTCFIRPLVDTTGTFRCGLCENSGRSPAATSAFLLTSGSKRCKCQFLPRAIFPWGRSPLIVGCRVRPAPWQLWYPLTTRSHRTSKRTSWRDVENHLINVKSVDSLSVGLPHTDMLIWFEIFLS